MDQQPNTTTETQAPPLPAPSPSRVPLFLIIAVIVVATYTIGFFSPTYLSKMGLIPSSTPIPTPTLQPSPSAAPSNETTSDTSKWKTFLTKSQLFPVTFQYPSELNTAFYGDIPQNFFTVYIDTQTIFFLNAGGEGPRAPIEIEFHAEGTQNFTNYDDLLKTARSNYTTESLKEETLSINGLNGVYLSGVQGPGYLAGERMSEAIINTPTGPVVFSFFGNTSTKELQTINEATFRSIVGTVKLSK